MDFTSLISHETDLQLQPHERHTFAVSVALTHGPGTFPSQLPSLVNLEQLDLLGNDFQPPLPVRSVLKRHSPGQDLSLLSNLSLVALVGQAPTETMPTWIRSGKFQSIYVVSLFKVRIHPYLFFTNAVNRDFYHLYPLQPLPHSSWCDARTWSNLTNPSGQK